MKKRLICLSLIFAMSATQVVPVAAAGKANVQTQKSATQNKLSDTEEKVEKEECFDESDQFCTAGSGKRYDADKYAG